MGIFRKVIDSIHQRHWELLSTLPSEHLKHEGRACFREQEHYLAEQIEKSSPFTASLSPEEVSQAMRTVLREGQVDQMLFLEKLLEEGFEGFEEEMDSTYNRLVRNGSLNGVERLFKATNVPITLDETAVKRGYDALAATGRIEAIDYLRQLSGIQPSFSKRALQTGYDALLIGGKLTTIGRLSRLSKVAPEYDSAMLDEAVAESIAQHDYHGLLALREATGIALTLTTAEFTEGIKACLDSASHIPAIVALSASDELSKLPEETMRSLFLTEDTDCLHSLYEANGIRALQLTYAQAAYQVAIDKNDAPLALTICHETGIRPRTADVPKLYERSFELCDLKGIEFLLDQEPPVSVPVTVQHFLYTVERDNGSTRARALAERLNVVYDKSTGHFIDAVANADFRAIKELYEKKAHLKETISWAESVYNISEAILNE